MAVFFRHFSTVSEKDSNRLQVAEGHSQVQRRATSGIHSLDLILEKNRGELLLYLTTSVDLMLQYQQDNLLYESRALCFTCNGGPSYHNT